VLPIINYNPLLAHEIRKTIHKFTSPMEPRIMSNPPKKKYVPVPAAPTAGPPVPRQPIKSHERGERESRKPIRALRLLVNVS
jgi:hypothetical protein